MLFNGVYFVKIFYRVLLTVDAVCLSFFSIFTMVAVIQNQVFDGLYKYISDNILSGRISSFGLFLVAFIFFCVNVSFILSGLKSDKSKKAISKYTKTGEIRISLNTIESIVLATAKKVSSIRDSKAFVDRINEQLIVNIMTVVMPEVNIPDLSEDLQLRIKAAVEESTGEEVSNIKVIVENIYTGYRSRVE